MAGVRGDEQAGIGQLAHQAPGMVDRHERVAIADGDQRGQLDSAQVARAEERLDRNVGGDRRQETPPRARAVDWVVAPAEERGPGRIVPIDPLGVHQAADNAGARLALGRDPDDDQGPQAFRVAGRELEGRQRTHRETEEVERVESQGVHKRQQVVNELAIVEPVGHIPTGRAMAAGIRQVQAESLLRTPAPGRRSLRGRWTWRRGA